MGNLGTPEIILIFLVILVLFGAKKIPELAQGLGKGIREFRKASSGIKEGIENEIMPPLNAATVKCAYCRSEVAHDAKFCPHCGKSLLPPVCPNCHASNPPGSQFCGQCGTTLIASGAT